MCHDPSWRQPSSESALMKIHFGKDPHELTNEELKKIEEDYGTHWYEDVDGVDENPLYDQHEPQPKRKEPW